MDEPIESDKVNAKIANIIKEGKMIKKCFTFLSYKGTAMMLSPQLSIKWRSFL